MVSAKCLSSERWDWEDKSTIFFFLFLFIYCLLDHCEKYKKSRKPIYLVHIIWMNTKLWYPRHTSQSRQHHHMWGNLQESLPMNWHSPARCPCPSCYTLSQKVIREWGLSVGNYLRFYWQSYQKLPIDLPYPWNPNVVGIADFGRCGGNTSPPT